uniref:Ascorbate-specific PTS system EIIC component n=1 Tax=Clostridioides difficile TaxID=1496 RepID=A0A381KLR1_CLODI|nr:PTS system ascorbate-specific transporter subunit IIC [Clostridioides difficile]
MVFPLIEAFTFVAGMSILMSGVRMFLAEITAAFVIISEKYIPGSRPALDVPTVFPYAPNAVIIGFISAYAAGLLAIAIMASFPSIFPVVIIQLLTYVFSQEVQLQYLAILQEDGEGLLLGHLLWDYYLHFYQLYYIQFMALLV